MIDNSSEVPEFTRRQKIMIIPLAIYVIGMIIYLCYDAEHSTDLTARRIHALIWAAPFIIYTLLTIFFGFVLPSRQLVIAAIQKKYWYLFNYGYKPGKVIYNKKVSLSEIYFENDNMLPFCVLYEHKPNIKLAFFGTAAEQGPGRWENIFWLELELTGNVNNLQSDKKLTDEDEKDCICAILEKIQENKERVSELISWIYDPKSVSAGEVYKLISEKTLPENPVCEIMDDGLYKGIISKSEENSDGLDEQKQFLLRFLQLLPADVIISFLLKVQSLIKNSDSAEEKSELENFIYPANAAFTLSTGKKIEDYIAV